MNEKKSVLELARGAIMERADYEMPGVIENIRDPNTSATAIRKITMTLSFKPDETRQNIAYSVKVETKLAPDESRQHHALRHRRGRRGDGAADPRAVRHGRQGAGSPVRAEAG